MPIGPGKYDAECAMVRKMAKADGVMVLVFGGHSGSGFSAQFSSPIAPAMAQILRDVADQIEADLAPVTH